MIAQHAGRKLSKIKSKECKCDFVTLYHLYHHVCLQIMPVKIKNLNIKDLITLFYHDYLVTMYHLYHHMNENDMPVNIKELNIN